MSKFYKTNKDWLLDNIEDIKTNYQVALYYDKFGLFKNIPFEDFLKFCFNYSLSTNYILEPFIPKNIIRW